MTSQCVSLAISTDTVRRQALRCTLGSATRLHSKRCALQLNWNWPMRKHWPSCRALCCTVLMQCRDVHELKRSPSGMPPLERSINHCLSHDSTVPRRNRRTPSSGTWWDVPRGRARGPEAGPCGVRCSHRQHNASARLASFHAPQCAVLPSLAGAREVIEV